MSEDVEPNPGKWAKVLATLDKLIADRRKADAAFQELIDSIYMKMVKDLPDGSADGDEHMQLVARYMQSKGLDYLNWKVFLHYPVLRTIVHAANAFQFDEIMRCWCLRGWCRDGQGYVPINVGGNV